jgi:hypothetical protein
MGFEHFGHGSARWSIFRFAIDKNVHDKKNCYQPKCHRLQCVLDFVVRVGKLS